jgi:hypothetical protein
MYNDSIAAEHAQYRRNEFQADRSARCGFCGRKVDGDITAIALPSEAFAAHPYSFVTGGYEGDGRDYEVFACNEGEGCDAPVPVKSPREAGTHLAGDR